MQTEPFRARRSALYMPGSNARALAKATSISADVFILDLEDSVAPQEKEAARRRVAEAVASRAFGTREVVVRVNAPGSPWGADDLAAIARAAPDAVLMPKVCRAADLADARAVLGPSSPVALWAMMETPSALVHAGEIADARHAAAIGLAALVVGANDLAKETRTRLLPGRANFVPWLTTCLAAARAGGLDILDGVFNDLDDEAGFAAECAQGADLGFDGKTLIHPRQVEVCNAAFAPDAAQIEEARRIVDLFERPENAGVGVVRFDGRMVERLHAEMARRTLALAEAGSRR